MIDNREQIAFLLKDAKTALDDGNHEGAAAALYQIFKLCEQENRGKTPPPAIVRTVTTLMDEFGARNVMAVMNEIYRLNGDKL